MKCAALEVVGWDGITFSNRGASTLTGSDSLFFSPSATFLVLGFLSLGDTLELVGVTALVTRFRFRDVGVVAGEEALAGGDGREVLMGALIRPADVSSLCCDLQ